MRYEPYRRRRARRESTLRRIYNVVLFVVAVAGICGVYWLMLVAAFS